VAEQSRWSRWIERFRLWRHPPAATGRWIDGHAFSWHGLVGFRPWVFPRRRFRVYVPSGWTRARPGPLVALIHGCRQTPEAFARGTRIEAAADRSGTLVLMPDQKDGANPYRCWNWFDGRTADGKGEAAIVAVMIRRALKRHGADAARVVVAGMSAGAALAAVLGVRHPSVVRGVFAHSGLACSAASSAFTALTVMRRGPEGDVARVASMARGQATGSLRVPLVVVHGTDDDVVARLHADALARQYLVLNGVDVPAGAATTLPPPDRTGRDMPASTRLVRTREWLQDGRVVVRVVEVGDLGHAWSGGDPAEPFHDPAPPDATTMLMEWAATLSR
jgi:poly(hydroxyalkanoate) depolymerase family esterase